jgi:Predicted membrane protein
MELVKTAIASVISIVVLFISAKLMGHRQISQLDSFDYISGITIGSIGAELATNIEEPMKPLIAMLIYLIFTVAINVLTNKSSRLRDFFNGAPTIIMNEGKIFKENMKKEKLDICEFLMMCRQAGYFDISQIETAVFEDNGRLTILPVSANRPLTPSDIGLEPPRELVFTELIMDGRVQSENLRKIGKNEEWLIGQLVSQGYSGASEVFLGIYGEEKLILYGMVSEKG